MQRFVQCNVAIYLIYPIYTYVTEDGNRCARPDDLRRCKIQRCCYDLRRRRSRLVSCNCLSISWDSRRGEENRWEKTHDRSLASARQTGSLTLFTNCSQRTARGTRTYTLRERKQAEGRGEGGTRSRGDRKLAAELRPEHARPRILRRLIRCPIVIPDRRTVVHSLTCSSRSRYASDNATCHWFNVQRLRDRHGARTRVQIGNLRQDTSGSYDLSYLEYCTINFSL